MKAQLLSTLENSKTFTLAVAAAMPAARYHFKPTNTVWSFAELLHHIGYGIYWWEDNCIKKVKSSWSPPAATLTKDETVRYLEHAFDSLKETLNSVDYDAEIIHGVYATFDHITHHRGQATSYLRCNDIVPPEYVF